MIHRAGRRRPGRWVERRWQARPNSTSTTVIELGGDTHIDVYDGVVGTSAELEIAAGAVAFVFTYPAGWPTQADVEMADQLADAVRAYRDRVAVLALEGERRAAADRDRTPR